MHRGFGVGWDGGPFLLLYKAGKQINERERERETTRDGSRALRVFSDSQKAFRIETSQAETELHLNRAIRPLKKLRGLPPRFFSCQY